MKDNFYKNEGILSQEEFSHIFSIYKETNDDALLNELVIRNEGLVLYFLKKYREHPDYDDILQEGRIGLLYAIKKYDFSIGASFSTYAFFYIKGYALRYFTKDKVIYFPENALKEMNAYKKAMRQNPNASKDEISQKLGISSSELERIEKNICLSTTCSLDAKLPTGDCLLELLESGEEHFEKKVDSRVIAEQVWSVIESKIGGARQREVIKTVFGIGCEPLTCRDAAKKLGTSYQYVSAAMKETVRMLRHPLKKMEIRKSLGIEPEINDLDVANTLFG